MGEETKVAFQSPQWGSNSKGMSPSWKTVIDLKFQSPQWGSNSKANSLF